MSAEHEQHHWGQRKPVMAFGVVLIGAGQVGPNLATTLATTLAGRGDALAGTKAGLGGGWCVDAAGKLPNEGRLPGPRKGLRDALRNRSVATTGQRQFDPQS